MTEREQEGGNVAEEGCAYVVTPEMKRLAGEHAALEQRVERAENAAKGFAKALQEISERKPGFTQSQIEGLIAREALASHPSFCDDAIPSEAEEIPGQTTIPLEGPDVGAG